MSKTADDEVRAAFTKIVNMTPREIEDWHKTEASAYVGQDCGDGVSIGVKAGQRTVQLLRLERLPNDDDVKHMRRVVSFINRMRSQSPRKDRETSRWRYALMNWGHDPLKIGDADSPWR